jgi:hypothetical protein
MTTLIRHYKYGRRVAQCDARCYNAKGKRCTCCCGGLNHGVGLDKALENTRRLANRYADEGRNTGDWHKRELTLAVPIRESEAVEYMAL